MNRMKKLLYILFIGPFCILSMLSIVYLFSRDEPLFFLQDIKVNGLHQLGDKEMVGKITPFLKESILKIDVVKVREAITSHPFVKEVRVKRVYPFSIVIDVKEKTPSALWITGDGKVHVLDEQGEPYRTMGKDDVEDLFIVNTKERLDAKNVFNEVRSWITSNILQKGQLSEVAFQEGTMTIFFVEDGVEIILGKEEYAERLKKALAVLEDARKRGLLIKCIDARFEKGAIIQERKG